MERYSGVARTRLAQSEPLLKDLRLNLVGAYRNAEKLETVARVHGNSQLAFTFKEMAGDLAQYVSHLSQMQKVSG